MYNASLKGFIATTGKPTFITPDPFAALKSVSAYGALKYKFVSSFGSPAKNI